MAKFGSLRKLPSGRWQARYTDHNNGRMISAPDTFRTKSDASAWLAARRADIDRGLIANDVAARRPLAAYWDDYLPSIEVRLRPSSVRDYSYSWSKWIEPRFGAVPVSKILPRDIDRWMADMQAKGMSAQKVRSAFGVLSRLLDRAVRDGAIPVNPASRRSDPLPRIRRVDRPVLTVAEVEDLVTHFEHEDDRVLVRLLAYGGLRIGEALALQRQDVDLKRGLLHVQRSVSDAGGVVRVHDTKRPGPVGGAAGLPGRSTARASAGSAHQRRCVAVPELRRRLPSGACDGSPPSDQGGQGVERKPRRRGGPFAGPDRGRVPRVDRQGVGAVSQKPACHGSRDQKDFLQLPFR